MTDPTAARELSSRDVLRIREYRLVWFAQLVSDIGDGLTNLALLLLVNALTGSTAALALMAIVLAVPPMTIGLVAGAYVDRLDRRRVMLASDLLRAGVVLGFVLVGSADRLWLLYVLAFVQATVGTFFNPARGALLPRIVPANGLLAANSVSQATRVVSGVIGAGLGGLLIGVLGTYWPAFVLDAATFLVSFLFVVRVSPELGRPLATAAAAAEGILASIGDGLATIARSRTLGTTLVALALSMLGLGAVNVLFVPLLVDDLRVATAWFGPVDLAQSSSMILAAGLIGMLAARVRSTTIVSAGLLGIGACLALMSQVSSIWQVLVILFAVGWFITPLQAAVVTVLQLGVPDEQRGRIMAALQAAMSGAGVLSMAFAGIAGDVVGVRTVFLAAGAILAVGGSLALLGYRSAGPRASSVTPPGAIAADSPTP
ncbi:MAG: MFS transporter [Chloroflexota bacterium]